MKRILISAIAVATLSSMAMASNIGNDTIQITSVNPYVSYQNYTNSDNFNNKKTIGVNTVLDIVNNGKVDLNLKYVKLDTPTSNPYKWVVGANYATNVNNYNVNIGAKYIYFDKSGDNNGYSFWVGAMSGAFSENTGCDLGLQAYYSDLSNLLSDMDVFQLDFIAKKQPIETSYGKLTLKNIVSYINLGTKNFDSEDNYLTDTFSVNLDQGVLNYTAAVSFGKQAWKTEMDNNYAMDTTGSVHKWGVSVGAGYKINSVSKVNFGMGYDRLDTGENSDINEVSYTFNYNYSF